MAKTLGEVRYHLMVIREADGTVNVTARGDYTVGTSDDLDLVKQKQFSPTVTPGLITTLTDRMNNTLVPNIKNTEGIP